MIKFKKAMGYEEVAKILFIVLVVVFVILFIKRLVDPGTEGVRILSSLGRR